MPCTFWVVKVIFALCIVHSGYSSPDAASVIDVMRIQWENKCLLSARTNPIRTASDIISKQTRLHRGCVAYYLHNHKSGGTTMCHTALKSGYHITSLEDNCNLPMEIVSMDREHRTQGIAQDFVLNHPKLSFVAQEQPPFYPNISNDKYIYITTFRNPIDRVISHLHHGICTVRSLENAQKFLHNGNCSIDNIEDMTLSDLILDPCFDKELLWLSSNYYVSMFTGCIINRKKMSTDGYTNVCSRKHLSIAQNMLHYFSVIMITDTFEEFGRYLFSLCSLLLATCLQYCCYCICKKVLKVIGSKTVYEVYRKISRRNSWELQGKEHGPQVRSAVILWLSLLCAHVYVHVYVHVCLHVCVHVCVVSVYVSVYVCGLCVCVCVQWRVRMY